MELFCLFLKVMGKSNLEIHFTKFQKIKSFILKLFQVTLTIRVLPGSNDPPRKRSPGIPVGMSDWDDEVYNFGAKCRCRQFYIHLKVRAVRIEYILYISMEKSRHNCCHLS